MKIILLLPVPLLFALSFAKAQDSLVYWSEIRFESPAEKAALTAALIKKQPDYFELFNSGVPSSSNPRDQFYRFLKGLDLSKFQDKKADKKVKFIYESLHKAFLTKYEAVNLFSDIWKTGYYNCVSATALYSIAFNYFDIPYVIKEKPNHVYPVAYPHDKQVIVETTNPMVGSFAFTAQFKETYIESLRKQKLISNQEASSKGVSELFDKYFFKEELDITLAQLVGIQYMNDGIFRLDNEKWLEATWQFEKAYLFYPSDQVTNGLAASYFKAFQQNQKKDSTHALLVARLSRFAKYGITFDMVKSEFVQAINSLLFDQGKSAELSTYYKVLSRGLKQKELIEEIDFLYNYEVGRYYYNQGRYSDSEPYFEKAFSLRPSNQEVQTIFLTLLERKLRGTTKADEAVTVLEKTLQENPLIKTNNNFNTLLATAYLAKFAEDFENNRPTEGDKYRLLFEQNFGNNKDLNINDYLIGQAYSTAAVYYFKKNQNTKAKTYIEKGLEYAPDNRELLMRKRALR